MDSSESPLEAFHDSLDVLTHETRRHLDELRHIANEDDAVISANLWDTLSPEQKKKLDDLKSSMWTEDDAPGKEILHTMNACNPASHFWNFDACIARCRELAGYGSDTLVCHQALDVFANAIETMHFSLRQRLYAWPRSPPSSEMIVVEEMMRLLHERKLHKLVAFAPQPDPDFLSRFIKTQKERKVAADSRGKTAGLHEGKTVLKTAIVWNRDHRTLFIDDEPFEFPKNAKRIFEVFDALQSAQWPKELVVKTMANREPWREAVRQIKTRNLPLNFEYGGHKILLGESHQTPGTPDELPPK